MTATKTDLSLTVERTIAASPEKVFDAWLDPEMLKKCMCPGPSVTTPIADTEARVGGRFDLVMKSGDDDLPHGGIYQIIDRPNRLQFTWESPFSIEGSVVTIDFKAVEEGTHVRLHHVRFIDEEHRDSHNGGWTAILAKQDEVLGENG